MDAAEYDEMLRRLMALTVTLGTAIDRHEAIIDELRAFNRQQVEINGRLEVTQARIETLLARLVNPSGNGQGGTTR